MNPFQEPIPCSWYHGASPRTEGSHLNYPDKIQLNLQQKQTSQKENYLKDTQ